MCFVVSKDGKLKIATEDIKCYKTLRITNWIFFKIAKSYYYKFKYKRGCLYEVNKLVVWPSYADTGRMVINEGFHSYREFGYWENAVFIIPKGASYYVNNDEYVSDKIIFKDFLDVEKERSIKWGKSNHI